MRRSVPVGRLVASVVLRARSVLAGAAGESCPGSRWYLLAAEGFVVSRVEGIVVQHWNEFGIRPLPTMSARVSVGPLPAPIQALLDERTRLLVEPMEGVTTDGTRMRGLFPLHSTGVDTSSILDSTRRFLAALSAEQIEAVRFPIASDQWRTWLNVHMNFFRHGIMLEDLSDGVRELALDVLRSTLSVRGFEQARGIMRINELIAQLSGQPDCFGEWPYFFCVFGEPDAEQPWGWQLDGHHLNVNCVVIGDQLVVTPTFMGSEPRTVPSGPLAGTELFNIEEEAGLALVRSLNDLQARTAIVGHSILPEHLSPELQDPVDGRVQAGAFRDNAVLPQQGIRATELNSRQRDLLTELIAAYVGWTNDGHAEVKMDEIKAHLDDTWFSWLGGTDDESVFYYRVHSPVVLIEFDHHPGVVFDVQQPTRHHVHTLVRTPNGGDYGTDLLRQHHQRYDHSNGHHEEHDRPPTK
jgi:hypothetical protein